MSNPETDTLFLGNLSYDASEDSIRRAFSKCGTIVSVRIQVGDDGRPRGFGYIQFGSVEEARRGLSLSGSEIDGREIRCDFAGQRKPRAPRPTGPTNPPSNTLFVGNLAFDATEADIRDAFRSFGTVTGVRIAKDQDGRCKGFGYVEFDSVEAATAALQTPDITICGREVRCDFATAQVERAPRQSPPLRGHNEPRSPPSDTLYVANLSYRATGRDLESHFGQFGSITSARVIQDRDTGRSKGFGYVTFGDEASAVRAMQSAPPIIDEREVRCDFAQPSSSRQERAPRNSPPPAPSRAPTDTIFCGSLSYNTTDDSLRAAFSRFQPTSVRIIIDREAGRSKGFGYVSFASVVAATAALQAMNGAEVDGRNIRLDFSEPRQERRR